jgi:DNA-binding GntR family transcriptional regulator
VRIRGQIKSAEIARGPADDLERARLQLPAGNEVYRVRRVHHYNDRPFLVEDAVLPADLFPALEQRGRTPDQIGVLAQEYRILLGNAEERVSSGVPPAHVAEALRSPPAVAVVVLDRVITAFDKGRPVEWRVAHSHLPGSYYQVELR